MKIKLFLLVLVSMAIFSCGRESNAAALGLQKENKSPKTEVFRESKNANEDFASTRSTANHNEPTAITLQGTNGDSELWGQ